MRHGRGGPPVGCLASTRGRLLPSVEGSAVALEVALGPPLPLRPVPRGGGDAAQTQAGGLDGGAMTLGRACPPECRGAQCAFKDSMVRWVLQFTLLIAFRCVLHRCRNQEIRC